MKLKCAMQVLLDGNPKALEASRKEYLKACTISMDLDDKQLYTNRYSGVREKFDSSHLPTTQEFFEDDDATMKTLVHQLAIEQSQAGSAQFKGLNSQSDIMSSMASI